MDTALLLLKVLRFKSNKTLKLQKSQRNIKESVQKNEKESQLSRNDQICRICLKDGDIPILGNNELLEPLNIFGSIQVHPEDPYPKYLCQPCHGLLQGAILFRKTALNSDNLLKSKAFNTSPQEEELLSDDHGEDSGNKEETVTTPFFKHFSFSCKPCNIKFTTLKEYTDHRFSYEHIKKRRSLCKICKRYYTPCYFKYHMLTHTRAVKYICDICGKNLATKVTFKMHRMTHFDKLPFKCPECPYRGRFSHSLRMHMRSHTGEKPFQCTICQLKFINKSNLNSHMFTHKQVRNYKCNHCPQAFYTKPQLDTHIKGVHIGLKEHECRLCGKSYTYRRELRIHEVKFHKREKFKPGRVATYLRIQSVGPLNGVANKIVA